MRLQKPSSLFWSWGAYVFLPINIVIGTIIFTNGASIEELIISSVIALVVMMLLAYPAVCLSSKYGKNYSKCIKHYIKNRKLVTIFILLVPLINIGWYAIQTAMFVDLLQVYTNSNFYIFMLLVFCMSYIFALGVTKFDYLWLKNAGMVGMFFLLLMLLMNMNINSGIRHGYVRFENIVEYTIQILGTWVFSSVTCIMDITSHVKEGKKGFKYIVLATFVTNILLIFLGFLINVSMELFVSISIMNLLSILTAIWTTNDSNFYSTICSLKELGISKKKTFFYIPLIASIISIAIAGELEFYLIEWLNFMSWVGIPFGIMWWIIYVKEEV